MSDRTGSGATLRLTALATHPIQYHAPWFRALAARDDVDLEVLFEHLPDARAQGEGFGRAFSWDVPLLDGYRWHALNTAGRRSRLVALAALRARLARSRPQVTLLTGWQSAVLLAAPLLARRAGARCLVRGESNAIRRRPRWLDRAHRALLARYDAFLTIGGANREFYRRHGVADDRLFACPYFVDNERFATGAAAADRSAERRRFGVPAGAVCFLFAGKLEAKKRPLDVIAALARQSGARVHLLVVGSGALDTEVRRAAAGLPVTFAGFLNQRAMAGAYAAGDCLVLPSDHGETWGLVVNEAMACARPAIVSDQTGCARDLVLSGRTGWVYPCADVAALAACMAGAASDPATLEVMGRAAQAHVRAGYNVERAADAVVAAARVLAAGATH